MELWVEREAAEGRRQRRRVDVPASFMQGGAFTVEVKKDSGEESSEVSLYLDSTLQTAYIEREKNAAGLVMVRPFWYSRPRYSSGAAQLPCGVVTEVLPTMGSSRRVSAQLHRGSLLSGISKNNSAVASSSRTEVRSSITGRIVQVNVEEGMLIEQRECLVIIEAMKMENKIFAPVGGVVRSVAAVEGEGTAAGKVLCIIEAVASS